VGHFYFDESIHDRGGFIVGAFTYCEVDLDPYVSELLRRRGLTPGVDEFKSSAPTGGMPSLDALREDFRGLVARTSLALLVAPTADRHLLGRHALTALEGFIAANQLAEPHHVFLDQGIADPQDKALLARLPAGSSVSFDCDSRACSGLQVADCAAHSASIVLLEALGIVNKQVPGREADGWEPSELYPLGFELWSVLRHAFFNGGLPPEPRGDDMFATVHPYGLYIAPSCSPSLAEVVMRRFGEVYLGCIH
jgi:hypothetical protein